MTVITNNSMEVAMHNDGTVGILLVTVVVLLVGQYIWSIREEVKFVKLFNKLNG